MTLGVSEQVEEPTQGLFVPLNVVVGGICVHPKRECSIFIHLLHENKALLPHLLPHAIFVSKSDKNARK